MSRLSHLRSVATLATRGGRGLPSGRNISSSTVISKVGNGFVSVGKLTAGYALGYFVLEDKERKGRGSWRRRRRK